MPMAELRAAARQCDVDAAGGRAIARRSLVLRPARFNRLLQLVGIAADVLFLIGRSAANLRHPAGDDAVLASEIAVAQRLGIGERRGGRELALEGGDVGVNGSLVGEGSVGHSGGCCWLLVASCEQSSVAGSS